MTSPNNTFVSGSETIEAPNGDIWTINSWGGGGGDFIRNGSPAGGNGTGIVLHDNQLWFCRLDGSWAKFNGWVFVSCPGPDLSAAASPPSPPPPPVPPIEYLFGMFQDGSWPTMAADLNRDIVSVLRIPFVATEAGWTNYEGSAAYIANSTDTSRRLMVGVGFFPNGAAASMAGAANGDYDAHYTYVANQFVGFPNTIVRIAWEFNASWYPWGQTNPNTDQANYVVNYKAAAIHLIESFRAVSPDFKFIFNPNLPSQWTENDTTWKDCYPGDDYVDWIGVDAYDPVDAAYTTAGGRWGPVGWGLARVAEFAALHSKPIALPEWGAGSGGPTPAGDNPLFVTNVAAWLRDNGALGSINSYWNGVDNTTGYKGDLNAFPLQKAEFIKQFKVP